MLSALQGSCRPARLSIAHQTGPVTLCPDETACDSATSQGLRLLKDQEIVTGDRRGRASHNANTLGRHLVCPVRACARTDRDVEMLSRDSGSLMLGRSILDALGEPMTINPLPFEPRHLTKQEFDRDDIYITRSPKNSRSVMLVGVSRLAFWIEREFTPTVEACVERPRSLDLYPGRSVELDFWTRSSDGKEVFWALVGVDEFSSSKAGVKPKDAANWNQSAQKAGLPLEFVYEHNLQRRAQRVANFLRLLPHVQASRRLADTEIISGRVMDLFSPGIISLSFAQIEASVHEFAASAVRVAVCTLIHAGSLTFPMDLPLSSNTRLAREGF